MRRKFFIRNGGNLLKQKISADNSCVMKIKIYDADEMEKVTDGFSRHRILGKGGQGTVYKGLLQDGTVVAIKKSNIIDEDEVVRFVNEVLILILAQISHRNIVKLLGCCLEYEVPLLVYEYLSNGNLSQHLHDGSRVSKFLWKDRVRIAKEVAEALAYLHSYASPTIFHRDIKPGNILLDKNYNAVVSDFGISRSVPISRSHLTTQIEGTFGYLDPEYFQSGKLTSKSDVYAFGVILTELLTRRRAVSPINSGEGLVPRFQDLIKHNLVISILDMQVVQEARMDDILLLAKLANRCMKKNAKKRPSMKAVVAKFDQLKVVQLEFPHQRVSDDECTF
ncbi:wall-associated receptor kinase-like 2 [Rutidosis leptorrhynchoides]|uniref:wall-associated receptor kinase-like 2 n=1 Tax=Rutidosis leptorrhynchoides TaxID=125765 RepID=UPI003A990499